jgi:hypothetical protein
MPSIIGVNCDASNAEDNIGLNNNTTSGMFFAISTGGTGRKANNLDGVALGVGEKIRHIQNLCRHPYIEMITESRGMY